MTPRGTSEQAPPVGARAGWIRLANFALLPVCLFGLGFAIFLWTKPEGERLQGPLGLVWMVLIATASLLSFVATRGTTRR